jgi:hypothetical protein
MDRVALLHPMPMTGKETQVAQTSKDAFEAAEGGFSSRWGRFSDRPESNNYICLFQG